MGTVVRQQAGCAFVRSEGPNFRVPRGTKSNEKWEIRNEKLNFAAPGRRPAGVDARNLLMEKLLSRNNETVSAPSSTMTRGRR